MCVSYQTGKRIHPTSAKAACLPMTSDWFGSHKLGAALFGAALLIAYASPSLAEGRKPLDGLRGALEPKGVSIAAEYTGEWVSAHSGAAEGKTFYLDNANVVVDWDLEKTFGWKGTSAYLNILSNAGKRPNGRIGTLEGVSNIEVGDGRWKVFEFSLTQNFGASASLEAGYIDLNRHFYGTESSGLLTGPPYGIGTELAVTGSNGPSIFPSAAPALVLALEPTKTSYVRLGVFGANANNWGDPEPLKNFQDGVLTIGEVGLTQHGLIALGGWRYSKKVTAYTGVGGPDKSINPWGIYGLLEQPLIASEAGPAVTGFMRAGYSDGETTDFTGSITAGILVERAISGRPNSQLSLGVRRAFVSDQFKDNARSLGDEPLAHESGLELTLADQLGEALTLQGSLHYTPDPGAVRAAHEALISNVRLTVAF
jgi:porin